MTGRDDVYRAETFEEHMHPDIYWLPNPEFDKAFDQIIEEEPMSAQPMADAAERARSVLLDQLKAEGWDTSNFGEHLWARLAIRAMIRFAAQKDFDMSVSTAASVPDAAYADHREAFEAAFPHLELDLKAKQWGPLPYQHDHVNSLFHGFVIGRMYRAYPDNPDAISAQPATKEDPPMEASITKTDSYYPGYINAKADERSIVLTVRGDAKQAPHGDGTALQAGEVVELRLTQDEMFDWLAQAMRLRVEEPHPSLFVEEPDDVEAMKPEQDPNMVSAGACEDALNEMGTKPWDPAQDPASTGRSLRDELEERDHNGGYTVAEERAGYAEFPNEPGASMRDTLDVIDDKDSVLDLTEDQRVDDTRPG